MMILAQQAAAPVGVLRPATETQTAGPRHNIPEPEHSRRKRETFAPNGNGESSSQGQLTQDRSVTPSRFNVRNKPVPTFSDPYPAAALGNGPRGGPYFVMRWAEDWSSLRKPQAGRSDLFDPLKYMPIAEDGSVYLTLSGESRARLNFTTNPQLRDAPAQEQYLIRNVVGADLHVGPHLRVFGEVASDAAFGSPGVDASPMQKNDALVQQLFGELTVPIGKAQVGVRVGRQEFMDGPPNIIHIRPAPNVYTALDGVRLSLDTRRFRASIFDFNTIKLGRGAFDDPTNNRERFRGISTSFSLPAFDALGGKAKIFFDPFVWNHRNMDKRWGTTLGTDDRNFYGARLWGTLGDATLDVTALRQDGRFKDRKISAWGMFANAGYLLSNGPWHPRIGGHFDYTSGGGAYGQGNLHTFSFFYGSIPYFSWGNLIGPSNLMNIAGNARVTPLPRVAVTVEYSLLRKASLNDAVYTFLEAPMAGTQLVSNRNVGSLVKADIAWQANPHLIVALKADFLAAGPALTRAGYASSTFFGPEIHFRF